MKKGVLIVLLVVGGAFALSPMWTESFEGTFPPTGWDNYIEQGSGPGWRQGGPSFPGGHGSPYSGSRAAWHNDDSGTHADWLLTPYIDLTDVNISYVQLHYWDRVYYPGWYEYRGIYVTTGTSDPPTGWDELVETHFTERDWTERDPSTVSELDLSSYIGQTIRLAFKYVGNWEDEWYLDSVSIDTIYGGGSGGEGYDIFMYRITDPSGDQVEPNKPIEPGCVVKNDDESADPTPDNVVVRCRIKESGGSEVYHEGKTIGPLEPGETKPVHFPAWTPKAGKVYTMTFYIDNSTVPGDEDFTNNKKVKDVACPAAADVGTIAIIFPTKETTEITEYPTPIGVFENFSTDTASFEVHCMVYSSSDPSKVYYDKKVDISALAPNVEDTVEFEQWVPTEAVDDDVVFTYYTVWAEDENPDNDTLTSDAVHANLGAGIVEYKVEEGYGITPNPSNGNTEIYYSVDHSSNVVIRLYDLTGSEVARLFSGKVSSGRHSITLDVSDMNPGIYFVRYDIGNLYYLKKLIITR